MFTFPQDAGREFDYIFGDLTTKPVCSSSPDNDSWEFLKTIISSSVSLLKVNTGKYMTHSYGELVPQPMQEYENMLKGLAGGKVTINKSERFVPGFYENWAYYQITRHS